MRFAQLYSLSSVVRVEPSDNKWLNLSLVRNLGGIPGRVEGVWLRVDRDPALCCHSALLEGHSSVFIFVVGPLKIFPSLRTFPVYYQSRFLGRIGAGPGEGTEQNS